MPDPKGISLRADGVLPAVAGYWQRGQQKIIASAKELLSVTDEHAQDV
jgi:hypothetical protein